MFPFKQSKKELLMSIQIGQLFPLAHLSFPCKKSDIANRRNRDGDNWTVKPLFIVTLLQLDQNQVFTLFSLLVLYSCWFVDRFWCRFHSHVYWKLKTSFVRYMSGISLVSRLVNNTKFYYSHHNIKLCFIKIHVTYLHDVRVEPWHICMINVAIKNLYIFRQ